MKTEEIFLNKIYGYDVVLKMPENHALKEETLELIQQWNIDRETLRQENFALGKKIKFYYLCIVISIFCILGLLILNLIK